jgi:hypothetical protein
LRGELQALRVVVAVVVGPVVVGTAERRGVGRVEIVIGQDLAPARGVKDADVDALDLHRHHVRLGVEPALLGELEVRRAIERPGFQLPRGLNHAVRIHEGGDGFTLHDQPRAGQGEHRVVR